MDSKKDRTQPNAPREPKLKSAGVIAITVLALLFLVFRPWLNQQFGIDEDTEEQKSARVDESKQDKDPAGANLNQTHRGPNKKNVQSGSNSKTSSPKTKRLDLKKTLLESSPKESTQKAAKTQQLRNPTPDSKKKTPGPIRGPPKSSAKSGELGHLTEVSKDILKSTAGLIYGPGSRDKHRLTHVMKHAKDDLTKPIHGVFDGDRNEILSLIDQAYERVKKNHRSVSSSPQGNRISYTIYFGKRIGYVGGKSGRQRKNPLTKSLVLVLEGEKVITAYPK